MKRVVFFMVWIMALGTVLAQMPVDKRRAVSAGGFVDVHVPNGRVRLVGTSALEVVVKGIVVGSQADVALSGDKDLTSIRMVGGVANLTVQVPMSSRLDVVGDSLNLDVSGLTGILRIRTQQGLVRVGDQPREVQVDSRKGEVHLDVVGSRVNVTAMQSAVKLKVRKAEVDVSTVSGPVTVDGEQVNGRFQSVSGDVSVTAGASRIHVSSSSGSVSLNLKGGEADVATMSGSILAQGDRFERGAFESYTGRIRFESGPEQNGRLQFKAHDGAVDLRIPGNSNEVTVNTQSGPIHVVGDGFDRGWIESRTGRVIFEGNLNERGALDVQTDGAVELVLPSDVDARFRIVTAGTIQNGFGETPHGNALDFSTGNGNAWINVHSRGDVWVRKRSVQAPNTPRSEADVLFDKALALGEKATVDERLEAFRAVLRKDRRFAPAHHEIAKLYMTFHTPTYRQWAQRALREALRLDPNNVTYHVTMGDLLLSQGFYYNAETQYQAVLTMAPENAHAAFKIGQQKLKSFLAYQDMVFRNQAQNVGGNRSQGIAWKEWGEKDRNSAHIYLMRSIASDADYRDAYYHLGLLYLESGQPDSLVMVAQQLLARKPNDKDALLFCGLGFQQLGEMDEAFLAYSQALAHMSKAERAQMESVELIASAQERKKIAEKKDGLAHFWFEKDPLYLTDYNEQKLDHYGRIAYANLRFGMPERGIVGWQTDMGEAYIKYGPYLGRHVGHGIDFGVYPLSLSAENSRMAEMAMAPLNFGASNKSRFSEQPSETWFYENFQLSFRMPDGFYGYRVSEKPDQPRLVDPYQKVKYAMPYQMATFYEQDSVRIELAYALPKAKLAVDHEGGIEMEDGVFVFDPNGHTVYRGVTGSRVILPASEDSVARVAGRLYKNHVLSMRQLRVVPGTYRIVGEVMDHVSGSIGRFLVDRSFALADTALVVSDLLLAKKIEPMKPFPVMRHDLDIIPNPTRTFSQSEPVGVYLEMYHLMRDEFGNTAYEITYRVGAPRESEIDPGLFMPVDFNQGVAQFEGVLENETFAFPDLDRTEGVHTHRVENNPDNERGSPEREKNQETRRNFSIRGTQQNEAWHEALHQIEAPVEYKVTYALPKSKEMETLTTAQGVKLETAVTASYDGHSRNDLTYLQVDVSQVPAGVHKLTVLVKDKKSGQVSTRSALFRVVE